MTDKNLTYDEGQSSGLIKSLIGVAKSVDTLLQGIVPQVKEPETQDMIEESLGVSEEEINTFVGFAEQALTFLDQVVTLSEEHAKEIDQIDSAITGLSKDGGIQSALEEDESSTSLREELTNALAEEENASSTEEDAEDSDSTTEDEPEEETSDSDTDEETTEETEETTEDTKETTETTEDSSDEQTETSSDTTAASGLVGASPSSVSDQVSSGLAGSEDAATNLSDADLTQVPESSPTHTSGPSKKIMDVLQIPASGPAADVLHKHAADMAKTYPDVHQPRGKEAELVSKLQEQNAGNGARQPGSLHLTDQQARQLSEAIAHNINVRRAAAAEQMMQQMRQQMVDQQGHDSFGGGGANFVGNVDASSSFQEKVLQLADQVVNANIPYAWGGGSLDGPSQGTTDGGGAADANGDYAKVGFDCSGWARYCFYQATGVELPRVSQAQYSYCTPVAEPMIGDLGFPAGGSPGHVVVYVGNGTICEAQQSGTNLMYSPADPSFEWGRPPESPNWALAQQ